MDYSSDSDNDAPIPQPEHHNSFLHELGGVALVIGKGVVTEGIVGLL